MLLGVTLNLSNTLLLLFNAFIDVLLSLLLDLLEAIIKIVWHHRGSNSDHAELLDERELKLEGLLILDDLLSLSVPLLLLAADLDHSCCLSLSLEHRYLDFASADQIVKSLLDLLFMYLSLCLPGSYLVIDCLARAHLQGMKITSEALAAIELPLIWMVQLADLFLDFLVTLLLLSGTLDDAILLSLHPLDVRDLLTLFLVVVAALPVFLADVVFVRVQLIELLFDLVDLLLQRIQLGVSLLLFSVGLGKVFLDLVHLLVDDLFLASDFLDLGPYSVLLCLESLHLRLDCTEALSRRDRSFKLINFFDNFALSLSIHGSSGQSDLQVLDFGLDLSDSVAARVHLLEESALLVVQLLDLVFDVAHLILSLALLVANVLDDVALSLELTTTGLITCTTQATLSNELLLLDDLIFLASLLLDKLVLLSHFHVELLL